MSAENAMKGRINSKIRKRVSEIVDNLVVAGAELGTLRVKEKVLEKSVISTAICDSMGVVIYANPSCLKLLGFSDQSLMVGRKAMDFWEEQLKAGEVIKTARREGSWVGELTARRKDGSLLPVQIAVQVLEDSSGQPQYFMGTFRDISDRIRMEDALRESEARYQALFYRSMECLYIHDFSGNFLDANDASLTLLGYTRDELPGINFSKLLSADQIPKAMACIQELLETGRVQKPVEFSLTMKNGGIRHVDTTGVAIHKDGKPCYVIGIARDMTDHFRVNAEIRRSQEELRAMSAGLSAFADNERRKIASDLHDQIGQSLTISKIKLQDLKNSMAGSPAAATMDEIVGHLNEAIQFTRSIMAELSPAVLYELGLSAALEWLAQHMQHKYGLVVAFNDDGWSQKTGNDTSLVVFKSVRELLLNVVKHANAKRAVVNLSGDRGHLLVLVQDNGSGFDDERKSLQELKSGGFGLMSVREQIQGLGGTLVITTKRGYGTTAVITVPVDANAALKG